MNLLQLLMLGTQCSNTLLVFIKHITIVYFVVLQRRKETQNRENAIQYDFIDPFRKIASLPAGNTMHAYRKNNINNSSNTNNKTTSATKTAAGTASRTKLAAQQRQPLRLQQQQPKTKLEAHRHVTTAGLTTLLLLH